jgi:hypothetical protein
MRTRKLMALKPHKYGTRHLTAGEEYEAPHGYALALVAVKKARYVPDKPSAPSVPRHEPEPETPSLDSLRLQATQLGINVDGRWGAHRLQQEIEARQR